MVTTEDCYHEGDLRVSASPLASFCCQIVFAYIFKLIIADQSVFSALMALYGTSLMVYSVGSHSFWLRQILYIPLLRPCYFYCVNVFCLWFCVKVRLICQLLMFFSFEIICSIGGLCSMHMWMLAGWKETGAHVTHFIFFKGEATKMLVKKCALNWFTPPLCFSQGVQKSLIKSFKLKYRYEYRWSGEKFSNRVISQTQPRLYQGGLTVKNGGKTLALGGLWPMQRQGRLAVENENSGT